MLPWLTTLWLPIVVSAVGIFVASSLIHMVFKWHQPDYRQFPNEDAVRAAVRAGNTQGGGEYMLPYCASPKDMATPEMQKKYEEGPLAVVTVWPPGAKMNKAVEERVEGRAGRGDLRCDHRGGFRDAVGTVMRASGGHAR